MDVEALLRSANTELTKEDLLEILAGVTAAPGDDGGMGDEDIWLSLVAPAPSADLTKYLTEELSKARQSESEAHIGDKQTRLEALRNELSNQNLDGFVIPLADEHQGEYVSKRARRLAWLTGFTGSAGTAIVLADTAAIFVDGRYTLQAAQQVDSSLFAIEHLADISPTAWIEANVHEGARLGFDPWLHSAGGATRLRTACKKVGADLTATPSNPVDAVWRDQPPPPLSPVCIHPEKFAGRSSADKRREVCDQLAKDGQDAVVLTAPDSIAWLANIRGGDVPYTPLALGFAILHVDQSLNLFMDRRKLPSAAIEDLDGQISLAAPSSFEPALVELGKAGNLVRLDPSNAAEAIFEILQKSGATIVRGDDPCALPKACKNDVELEGMRSAHRRDGVALVRFLAWLDGHGAQGTETEISAADKLEEFRRQNDLVMGLSFPTISGAGPNGAIVHYRVTPESDRALETGSLFLVDSGAQYLDGTTDVTRTISIGQPSDEMRDRFTRVLKGHIALATATFPPGTSGSQLDTLARKPLWEAGLDFDHGTGHGVGSYLAVHEGPHRISKVPNRVALKPGMVVSNEPGYYKTDEYGIRIENLVAVVEVPAPAGAERELLGFETLTLAPIDLNLVDAAMLTELERQWLNAYHARVRETIAPEVDKATAAWLTSATREI